MYFINHGGSKGHMFVFKPRNIGIQCQQSIRVIHHVHILCRHNYMSTYHDADI